MVGVGQFTYLRYTFNAISWIYKFLPLQLRKVIINNNVNDKLTKTLVLVLIRSF